MINKYQLPYKSNSQSHTHIVHVVINAFYIFRCRSVQSRTVSINMSSINIEPVDVQVPNGDLNNDIKDEYLVDPYKKRSEVLYGVDDVPPWYMCLLLGFQVILLFTLNAKDHFNSRRNH